VLERREATATGAADAAQAVALSALVFLLEDEERTSRFLRVTGIAGDELAQRVQDPAFLGGILDFILEDEALLVAVAGAAGMRPDRVAGLRRRLPGYLARD
jgi:hypothetical protein